MTRYIRKATSQCDIKAFQCENLKEHQQLNSSKKKKKTTYKEYVEELRSLYFLAKPKSIALTYLWSNNKSTNTDDGTKQITREE